MTDGPTPGGWPAWTLAGDGLLVMLGGAVGAGLRWVVTLAGLRLLGPAFPVGTLIVNVVGAAALGLLLGAMPEDTDVQRRVRLLVGTGGLGGLTTFSTWSGEIVMLAKEGQSVLTAAHLVGTMALGLGGFFVGYLAGVSLVRSVRG